MSPGGHAFISWWTANVVSLSRRDRLLVLLGGILPDVDGLSVLFGWEAFLNYHHLVAHNLAVGLLWLAVAAITADQRGRCLVLVLCNWHLHLACDYFGSGGYDGSVWVLPYFYPLLGSHGTDGIFVGPDWYWNPWQWQLRAWPNLLIVVIAGLGWLYIAVRLDRTWFEFIWPAMDRELCRTLRRWFGGQPVAEWSEREGRFIRRSFVLITTVAVLACVVAASQARSRTAPGHATGSRSLSAFHLP
jgi:hypothetical protein